MGATDEDKTTFYTENDTFCYTKIPFRLQNAGRHTIGWWIRCLNNK